MINFLNFSASENVLIFPSFLRIFLLDTEFWSDSFVSALERHCATLFWHSWFLMRSVLLFNFFSSTDKESLLFHHFQYFSFDFSLRSLTMMCVGVDFFCIYHFWSSLSFLNLYIYIFYCIWESFSHYFFEHFFFRCNLPSPSRTPMT